MERDSAKNSVMSSIVAYGIYDEELAKKVVEHIQTNETFFPGLPYNNRHTTGRIRVSQNVVSITRELIDIDNSQYYVNELRDPQDTRKVEQKEFDEEKAITVANISKALNGFFHRDFKPDAGTEVLVAQAIKENGVMSKVYIDASNGFRSEDFSIDALNLRVRRQYSKGLLNKQTDIDLSIVKKWPTNFTPSNDTLSDQAVADVLYILSHGGASFKPSEYSFLGSITDAKSNYEKWHKFFDKHFDTLDNFSQGQFKYVIYSKETVKKKIQVLYSAQISGLMWTQTNTISSDTDYLFVDTNDIPGLDNFLRKQQKIDNGDIQGAAAIGKNLLEKAIDIKNAGGKIKILPLKTFCKWLKKEDFGTFVYNKPLKAPTKAEIQKAERAAKKESLPDACESLIAEITAKSNHGSIFFTTEELIDMIEESGIKLSKFEKHIKETYDKSLRVFFDDLGVLKSARSEFNAVLAQLRERYQSRPKPTDVTALVAENADINVSVILFSAKRFTNLTAREFLLKENILAGEESKSFSQLTAGVQYVPGQEPDNIKKRLDTLFAKLDEAYPDKAISGLSRDHKKWGETVTELYRKLGYASSADFLRAYGYTIVDSKGGRPKGDHTETVEELKRRYPNGANFKNVEELMTANADIAKKLNTLQKDSQAILGMSFGKWLKSVGMMGEGATSTAPELQHQEKTEQTAYEEMERKAREEAERKAREEAERKAREEAERKAREEVERKAREEVERKAREEAERKEREEAERRAREEAEALRKAKELEQQLALEAAYRKAQEDAERRAREVAERKAREEAERKAKEEAERKAREEAERKAREEAERKARAEAERKAKEEAERKAREEAERKAREEAERKAREKAERKARAEAERKAKEEAERKAREEAELAKKKAEQEKADIANRRAEFIANETATIEKEYAALIDSLSQEYQDKETALMDQINDKKLELDSLEKQYTSASFFAFMKKSRLNNAIHDARIQIKKMESEKFGLAENYKKSLAEAQTKRDNRISVLPMRAGKKYPMPKE